MSGKICFEKKGYRIIQKQNTERQEVILVNFIMEKEKNNESRTYSCGHMYYGCIGLIYDWRVCGAEITYAEEMARDCFLGRFGI